MFDYKLFRPGQPLVNGSFVMCEQVMLHWHILRVTSIRSRATLPCTTYHRRCSPAATLPAVRCAVACAISSATSDNRVYDPYLFNVSGFALWEQQYGSYFSFTETPRAQIFRRQYQEVIESIRVGVYDR